MTVAAKFVHSLGFVFSVVESKKQTREIYDRWNMSDIKTMDNILAGLNNLSYRCWVIVTTNFTPFPWELIAEEFSKAEEISLHTSGCTKLDKDVVESFCINISLFLMCENRVAKIRDTSIVGRT